MIQDQIIATIAAYDTIIIHRHIKPDPDALGSQGGLAAAIQAAFPTKHVYKAGGPVGDLAWLSTMDEVPDGLYQGALVIVVDTADRPRISDQRFAQGAKLIKIDHHPNDDAYGDLIWVDDTASSVSEMIFDLVQRAAGWALNAQSARLLYAGIVGDTGRFLYNNTTPHTFEAAARLIQEDFDPAAVNNQMGAITFAQAKLQGYIFNHLTITPAGAATVTIPLTVTHELGLTPDQVHAGVGAPGRLAEVQAWALFVEQEGDEPYRVNLRSKGPVINGLAKAHRGGGHPLASGAKAADQAEITQITAELSQIVAASRK